MHSENHTRVVTIACSGVVTAEKIAEKSREKSNELNFSWQNRWHCHSCSHSATFSLHSQQMVDVSNKMSDEITLKSPAFVAHVATAMRWWFKKIAWPVQAKTRSCSRGLSNDCCMFQVLWLALCEQFTISYFHLIESKGAISRHHTNNFQSSL